MCQVLFSILKQLSQKPGEASITSKGRNKYVKLPAMCPNDLMKTNVLPLGYQCAVQPDSTKTCDMPGCQITCVLDEDWVLFNGCFHSFHKVCLKESTSCPLFQQFLQKKVWELGNIAKQAILHPASDMQEEVSNMSNTSTTTTADADEMEIQNIAVRGMETAEFEHIIEKMNNEISSLQTPPRVLPNVPVCLSENVNISSSRAPPHCTKHHHSVKAHKQFMNNSSVTCNACPNNTCILTHMSSCANRKQQDPQPIMQDNQLAIIATHHLSINEWQMPPSLCQSNIGGRLHGSNACTVISMLTALHFLEGSLPLPQQIQDLSQIVPVYSHLIFKGNHIFSSFNLPRGQPNMDVKQVLDQKNENFQKLTIIEDTGFFTSQNLQNYLTNYHDQNPKFAAVLIVPPDKSMVLCFDQTVISLFESHSHGQQGAIISTSSSGNVGHFVQYLERMAMRDWQTHLHGANLAILGLKEP